jgi:glycosyltransferase involved in cell wall biosynthesis
MVIVHLTASTFYGGPERQMLGLAQALAPAHRTVFVSFREGGRCEKFLDQVRRHGFRAVALAKDTPFFRAAVRELTALLRDLGADVLCCHAYKANLLGRVAARRAGIPVVAVSRGWTAESWKVRFYEALDRLALRWMDRVICVSAGQAEKVRCAGVPEERIVVIRNAIDTRRFHHPDSQYREKLRVFFPSPPARVILAAGRLSPEKGFGVLVEAARRVREQNADVGVVLFGEGKMRPALERLVAAAGLKDRFILAGFRTDLDAFLPFADLVVLPSFTEGLPNVTLEALAAGVPVVATAVGGNPEVVEDGRCGYLVPPGDPAALAERILDALHPEDRRRRFGEHGRERVREQFGFTAQAAAYQQLFAELQSQRALQSA